MEKSAEGEPRPAEARSQSGVAVGVDKGIEFDLDRLIH